MAQVQERKYGRARKLLNASMKDKSFDRNVTDALGVYVNMSVGNWSDYYSYTYRYYTWREDSDSSDDGYPVKTIAIST
jgi:hypothetical protein